MGCEGGHARSNVNVAWSGPSDFGHARCKVVEQTMNQYDNALSRGLSRCLPAARKAHAIRAFTIIWRYQFFSERQNCDILQDLFFASSISRLFRFLHLAAIVHIRRKRADCLGPR